MRRAHFDALRPICPRCRLAGAAPSPLRLARVLDERDGHVVHAIIHCESAGCQLEFPVLDGVPILMPDPRAFLAGSLHAAMWRDDLPEAMETLLGDAAGAGSPAETTRYHLSVYAWDHYAEFEQDEARPSGPTGPAPGSVVRALARARTLAGATMNAAMAAGPTLDLGCGVGRSTFELARDAPGLTLGIDANLAFLRLAQRLLRDGRATYPRRRVGLVYDRREVRWSPPGRENADFWCCDAAALPFENALFAGASALNLLDCLPAPFAALTEWRRVLRDGAPLVLTTPYDWSASATPTEQWLGGHSQRAPARGASEAALRHAVAQAGAGFEWIAEDASFPWHVRLHDRATTCYDLHVAVLRAAR